MKCTSLDEIKEQVINFCKDHEEVVAAYIFGSAAKGKNRQDSDIDIAIMTNVKIDGMTKVSWETTLSLMTGRDVDLCIFGQAGVLLRHQILKYGKLLYEKDRNNRIRQVVFARAEYLDTRHLYRKVV